MAANHMDQIPLKVFIDKERNKVVYAEAGKDFVDVLFSFLTLPLGTIARLVANESNIKAVQFGSISSLYQGLSDLDEKYLWSQTCKEMLLKPKNSLENSYLLPKINIDETGPLLYLCEDYCETGLKPFVSYIRNQKCICGKLMNKEISRNFIHREGYLKETSTFIVSDNLDVMPIVVGTSLNLLKKLVVNCCKQTVNFNKKEVIDILKLSLISKTPLTDFIFKKENFVGNLDPRNRLEFWIGEVEESSDPNAMVVKVLRRKSNEQILFVEAHEDFADFVFSFLTFPLGGILHVLHGLSFLSCIDNLYNSITGMSLDNCFRSPGIKNMVIKPPICVQFELKNQILPIPVHSDHIKDKFNPFHHVNPKSPISGGYANGPLTFMVTDDLIVTPMSSINVVSYLERMKVPPNDVEERVVKIGVKEGLSILKASLTTTSALSSLNVLITEQFLQEQMSQSTHIE